MPGTRLTALAIIPKYSPHNDPGTANVTGLPQGRKQRLKTSASFAQSRPAGKGQHPGLIINLGLLVPALHSRMVFVASYGKTVTGLRSTRGGGLCLLQARKKEYKALLWTIEGYQIKSLREVDVLSHSRENPVDLWECFKQTDMAAAGEMCAGLSVSQLGSEQRHRG